MILKHKFSVNYNEPKGLELSRLENEYLFRSFSFQTVNLSVPCVLDEDGAAPYSLLVSVASVKLWTEEQMLVPVSTPRCRLL